MEVAPGAVGEHQMTPKRGRPQGQIKQMPGWEELRLAVLKQAVSDYRQTEYRSRQIQIERWILSCPYQLDADMCRVIVDRLREGT